MKKNKERTLVANRALLAELNPKRVFEHFLTLCAIPRTTYNEAEIGKYIYDMAVSLNLEATIDGMHNVLVRVPASVGYESRPHLCLQSHIDMVPATKEGMSEDEIYPIELTIEEGWLCSIGTTLGADNGIGVAMMMAIMEDGHIKHGPLELLFTTVEEKGMDGAKAFDYSQIKSNQMINLDSEHWGSVFIGCAGGLTVGGYFEPEFEPAPEGPHVEMRATVKGLKGGHSGLDIGYGRANAVKFIGYIANKICSNPLVKLVSISAGDRMNQIPVSGEAVFLLPVAELENVEREFGNLVDMLSTNFPDEENVEFDFVLAEGLSKLEKVMSEDSKNKLTLLIGTLPHGVQFLEQNTKYVRSSCNLASIKFSEPHGVYIVELLYRSSLITDIEEAERYLTFLLKNGAGSLQINTSQFAPWAPNYNSELAKRASATFEGMFGEKMDIAVIHAGLECTEIFLRSGKRIDIISFGPTIVGAHGITERVDISTVEKCWEFLLTMIAE